MDRKEPNKFKKLEFLKDMTLISDIASASITPYETVDKKRIIRPPYPEYDEDDILDEVGLGWVRDLKKVSNIEGIDIYWNKNLAKRVMEATLNVRRLVLVKSTIYRMFKKAIIIPGFSSKSMFRLILSRISSILFQRAKTMAFFHQKSKKIFIILESMSNVFFQTDDLLISKILVHELLHYTANTMYSLFFRVFREELISWYMYYFCDVFKCDPKNPAVKNQVSSIMSLLVLCDKSFVLDKIWKKYKDEVRKLEKLSSLSPKEFKYRFNLHFNFIWLYFKGDYGRMISFYKEGTIPRAMFNAYKFGIGTGQYPKTFPVQELFYASEIICCYSEIKLSSSMVKIINSIRV